MFKVPIAKCNVCGRIAYVNPVHVQFVNDDEEKAIDNCEAVYNTAGKEYLNCSGTIYFMGFIQILEPSDK